MCSGVAEGQWLRRLPKNVIFLRDLSLGVTSVVIGDDIAHRSAWAIGSPVWMTLFWQQNVVLFDRLFESGKLMIKSLSKGSLSLGGGCTLPQRKFIGLSEVLLVLWSSGGIVSCPYSSY